jgi:hypothetical protein
MQHSNSFWKFSISSVLTVGLFSAGGSILAQAKTATVPDAQIEANVLKALAGAPQLADQSITSTTVFGTVTLNGTVKDEASRDLADKLVSNTAGVQKVVDQIIIGPAASAGEPQQADSGAQAGSNPNLQSDGSMGPPQGQASQGQSYPNPGTSPQNGPPQQAGQYPPYGGGQSQPGQNPPPYGNQPQAGQYPPQGQYPQQGQYPPPYGTRYPQQPYTPQYSQPQRPYVAQKGGDAVVVPSGSMVRVRINQSMSSKKTAVGTVFDGVVLNDVIAGGSIAIPRGAAVTGTVVESHPAGDFKGKGELKLQLTQIQLGGRAYPIVTDFWWHQGADKTGNTVGNTVGLGAMGALIGAVAGGGVGAAVGAGVGGVAGLGVSASSHRGDAELPSEAIVTFHLTQPTDITTVSQAELNRLGAGVPAGAPQMQRRYPPPPPPYYGPGYYPPPY